MFRTRYIAAVFVIFFVAAYGTIGYARHHLYDGEIEEFITEMRAAGERGARKPMSWETHSYYGPPERALILEDPVYKDVVYTMHDTYIGYLAEYQTEVGPLFLEDVDDNRLNLWDAYKKKAIFETLRLDIIIGGNTAVSLGPGIPSDVCDTLAGSIASWGATGGEREGTWMEVYEQSPEYEAWLNQYFTEISGPKEREPPPEMGDFEELIDKALSEGMSEDDPYIQALRAAQGVEGYMEISEEIYQLHTPLNIEERYRASTEELELPFWVSLFCRDILEAEQLLIETAYDRYTVHLAEKDIVRTALDSGIVEYTGGYLDRTAKRGYDLSQILTTSRFPLKNLIIDTLLIVVFSVVSTILVVKYVLPGRTH
jgi:hypothetical protein